MHRTSLSGVAERQRRDFGWYPVRPESAAGQAMQKRFCLFAGIHDRLCRACSSGSGTTAFVPGATSLCQVPPPRLHRHPVWGLLPVVVLCTLPVAHEVCLGSARPVAVSPILKGFSCLLVMQPCWFWVSLPPALSHAGLIYFNIMSSFSTFIFHFLTAFIPPSLAFLWAKPFLLHWTPRAGQAVLGAWQKSFPICSGLNSSRVTPPTWTVQSSTGGPSQWLQWYRCFFEDEKNNFWIHLPQSRSVYDHLLEVLTLQLSTLWFYLL